VLIVIVHKVTEGRSLLNWKDYFNFYRKMATLSQLKQWHINFRLDEAKKLQLQQFADNPFDHRLINLLRTRYWYAGLKQKTGLTTAYQLECHFEPLDKTKVDTRTPFRNKWSKYQNDKHKPGPALISLVDSKIPGSAREINHPLWRILQLGDRALPKIDIWMEKLEPRVQMIVYCPSKDSSVSLVKQRQPYSSGLSRRLLKIGNLDALTALVLYWRESKQRGNYTDNQWQARDIYRLLLMMGMDFGGRNIAEELYVVFWAQIFNQTDWEGRVFGINSTHYIKAVELLFFMLYDVPELKPFSSWTAYTKAMVHLLEGRSGLSVKIGLDIVLIPTWQYGPPTEQQWRLWQRELMEWQWGWLHLCMETIGSYGQDWLWVELAKELSN